MKNISLKLTAAAAALMCISGAALAANNTGSKEISAAVNVAAEADNETSDEKASAERDIYEIGSVSKTVCAVACCKLADEGKLDLDAPVTDYIPEFKMKDERYKDITVRMLLNHTSGIMGDIGGGCYVSGDDDGSFHDSFLKMIAEQELKATPGEYAVYCNAGYGIAQIVVEHISGMNYGEFIKKEIAEPLGLENFGTGYVGTDRDRFVKSKTATGKDIPWINCCDIASGGMWSTADDLALFSRVLADGNNFLSESSKAMIMNTASNENGFGLGIDQTILYPYDLYGKRAVFKGGSLGNFQTALTVIPEDRLSIAVCTQGQGTYDPMMMAQDIILSVLKEEGLISDEDMANGNAAIEEMLTEKECEEIPVPESMKKYAGYYGCYGIYKIDFDENFLILENINSIFKQELRLKYAGDGKFCSYDGNYMSFSGAPGQFSYKSATNRGTMTVWFEEERGKIFLASSISEEMKDLGTANMTSHMLEKLSESEASEDAVKAWAEREGNVYYLVRQPYNASSYIGANGNNVLSVREDNGYICGYDPLTNTELHAAVITDELHSLSNTDVKGQGSRDLINYEIAYMDGAEYLRGEGYTYGTYRLYSDMENTASLSGRYVLDTPDDAVWFSISDEDEGNVLKLATSENSAWYVYNKYGSCIASSMYLDSSDSVILPEDGMLLLAGKSGEYVEINRYKY